MSQNLVSVILLVSAFLFSLQKHTVKSSSLLAPPQLFAVRFTLETLFMSCARGAPCTHKNSVHWQQNESKGWFSGECGFQGHFICKHNFFYWALSDAMSWHFHQLLWLRLLSYRRFSSLAARFESGKLHCHSSNNWKTKIICKLSHNSNTFLLELISWPRASSWIRNCTLNEKRRVARRKALGARRKGCWGFLVGSRTFSREKMQKLVIATPPRHLVVFCANLFQHQKFQQSCQQNGARNVQLLKSSETSKKVLSRNKASKFLGEELGISKIPDSSWSWGAKSGWHLASRCCQETWSHLAWKKDNSMKIYTQKLTVCTWK